MTQTVIVRRIIMIALLLLVSLFCTSTQDGNGQEKGVLHCGPQNLTLYSSDQMIMLTWEDDPSCSAVHDKLTYEVVLTADKQEFYHEVAVMPDQIGSTHSWNWTSFLALECASHSVRLSSRYKNHTSPWQLKQSLPGMESPKRPEVFPRDKVFKVGSTVIFYCVLPIGEILCQINLTEYDATNMNVTNISNQIYSLTVHLNQASKESGTDVICQTNKSYNGATVYIGYPPGDRDLRCETRDLESVECHWKEGRETHLAISSPTVYELLGSPCANEKMFKKKCTQKVQVDVGERNWTLTAQNKLGKVELLDRADLTKRVHMFPPEEVTTTTVNARNASLEWGWTVQQYNNLNITCQVNISHGEANTISENFGVGLNFAVLNDLIPDWTYNVKVRCGTTQHFWKWSDWSASVSFHTRGDVPDALDVWMQMKDNQTIIIWKMPLANQSHGNIIDYEVTWSRTTEREQQNTTKVAHNKHSLDPYISYKATVTARNIHGNSSPSTITIPSFNPDRTRVNNSRIIGSNGSFKLSWSASPKASCGYIVDWCPTLGHCSVEWLKVSPNETSASIFSKNFSEGVRYSLSIYACTQGAPVLLERREGYVSEERIEDGLFKSLKWKQQFSDVEVSWDPISPREQTAFIQGYVLYCLDNYNNIVINVSKDDPEATSLTARNLKISSYTFTVKAKTTLGECGAASITAVLNPLTNNSIVFISLVAIFVLLSLITILCYRHRACIIQKVYPPIPKPVLMDKWLTSPGEHSCRPLRVDQRHHSEADIMDIPEVHYSTGTLVNDYVSQENMPFVFAQTPMGYYNQSLKKCTSPPLPLPTVIIPSESGLPSSPFRSVFPNPSYNLIFKTGDQQSSADLQEETPSERISSGYQPQSKTETFTINQTKEDPESPISCDSSSILLPQSPSK